MSKIEIEGLYKIFGPRAKTQAMPLVKKGKSKAEILKQTGCTVGINDASFQIEKGEIFVIMGLSGSGKSTVIRCLNRLIEPTSGSVKIDGENIVNLPPEKLREVRRKKMGMVFQKFGLLPHRSVIDNVAFGLEIQGLDKNTRLEKAREAIDLVGLQGYEESMTQALSGGMQQRVGLARALANDPEILLMDEAFSALDPLIRVGLQNELLELQARMHKTIVFITHDLDEALKLGDRIAIMKDGEVIQIGTPEEILTEPANEYVRSFVENVDRSKVITAGTVMEKPYALAVNDDGPHLVTRKMKQTGHSTIFAVDRERNFLGYVSIDDSIELTKKVPLAEDDQAKRNIRGIIRTDVATCSPETSLNDLLNSAANSKMPIVVTDENGKFKGIVSHVALISGIAGDETSETEVCS
ncbi:MAG: glycine betaine/L-proline ABC transporter ATP-binding protein [Opitutales bacterium]|nr:glycine betaine/L-proline ABC transporter ATP-binding protein [Opitutales bacterium]